MRAVRFSFENRVSPRGSLRIDRAPAREPAGQYFKRQQGCRDPHESFVGFLRASGRRRLPEELPKLPMRFDEGPESGLPQYIRQTRKAVQLVVALDQAPALYGEAVRQEAEVRTLEVVGMSRISGVVCTLCHGIHCSAPRPANRLRSMRRSITSRGIYLRWPGTAIFIGKK